MSSASAARLPARVNSPALLILDEPTSGVHIKTRHEVLHCSWISIAKAFPFYSARRTLTQLLHPPGYQDLRGHHRLVRCGTILPDMVDQLRPRQAPSV